MSNYATLKATIDANIKANNNQEITGTILNSILNDMVDALAGGYLYMGVASPSTSPGTPDINVAYIAGTAGTYANFGGVVLADNELAMLKWNGSWTKETINSDYDELDILMMYIDPILASCLVHSEVDASSLSLRNFYITAEGVYNTNNTNKHSLVAVKKGQVVKVTASEGNTATISFLKSNASAVSGGTPDFSDDYVEIYRVVISAGQTQSFSVPDDALYMYVYRGTSSNSYQYTPARIEIFTPAFDKDITSLSDAREFNFVGTQILGDALLNGGEYEVQEITIADLAEQDLYITGDNTFHSSGKHCLFYVDPGDVVKIVGNGGRVSFVSGVYCPNSGSSTAEIQTRTLAAGETYFLRAEENAVGFLFNKAEGSTDVTPTSIVRYHLKGEEATFRSIPCLRFSASGGALVYAAYTRTRNALFKVKAGHKYFLHFTPNSAVAMWFVEDIPYIECPSTSISLNMQAAAVDKDHSIALSPATDGYYLMRLDKSSSPSLTATMYDADQYSPEEDDIIQANTLDFWRLNLNALTLLNYRIDRENGLYASSTSYKHVLLPVKEGQFVKIEKDTYDSQIAWYTEADTPSSLGIPPYVEGTTIMSVEGGIFKVPAGANYLYVYVGTSSHEYWPSYIGISVDYADMPEIVRLNDYLRERRILEQMNSITRAEDTDNQKPLVLLHYSDIHGRVSNQNRINEFREYFKDFIDDTIQTGDLVTSYWGDGSAFGDESDPDNSPNRDILSVIGNHDVASKSGGDFVWHTYQGLQAYERYIKPYVEYWDVEQPTGADENGYCFYYKDYTTEGIRLVVIDAFDNDETYQATQQAWFADVLASARTSGLAVLVASHFRIKCESLMRSPFTMPFAATENPDSSIFNDPYVPLVKAFIDAGGELIGWISGHSHYDAISKTSAAQGDQINVCIANAGRFGSTATTLYLTNAMIEVDFSDWKTFDLFNIMAIDTRYKFITLYRIGSNYDKMGRRIETTTIKYNTGEIIYP